MRLLVFFELPLAAVVINLLEASEALVAKGSVFHFHLSAIGVVRHLSVYRVKRIHPHQNTNI